MGSRPWNVGDMVWERAGHPTDALIGDAVGSFGFVAVSESLVVAG
jgi:hypothetical protein